MAGVTTSLSKESVLAQTDGGKKMFSHVMKEYPIEEKKKYLSPFYQDTNPALIFRPPEENGGRWTFHDFGAEEYSGDVFNFAGFHYNLNPRTQLNEIISRIAGDLYLNNSAVPVGSSSNGKGTSTTTITLTPGKDYKESTNLGTLSIKDLG